MDCLLSKDDVREILGLKTVEATEKLLSKLSVPKVDFSIMGGRGIRYRKIDIEEAIERMEVVRGSSSKPKKSKVNKNNFFDLTVSKQVLLLTATGRKQ